MVEKSSLEFKNVFINVESLRRLENCLSECSASHYECEDTVVCLCFRKSFCYLNFVRIFVRVKKACLDMYKRQYVLRFYERLRVLLGKATEAPK
jgi:hypothetical protein